MSLPTAVPPTKSSPGSRADTRTRILAAALELFAAHGYAATTTAEIARAAGVAEKTIFAHFPTKETLFDQTLTPATIDLLIPEVLTPVEDTRLDGVDRLDVLLMALMKNRFAILQRHPSTFRLVIQEMIFRPERARQILAERKDPITPKLERAFTRLRGNDELRDVPTSLILRMYAYVLLGYAAQRLLFPPRQASNDEAEFASMVDVLVQGLRPRAGTTKSVRRPSKSAAASRSAIRHRR